MNQSLGAFTAQISRKRKEREDLFLHSHYHVKGKQLQSHPKTTSSVPNPVESPVRSNRILSGYLAHEFLTKGTLFGQIFDPVRSQAVSLSSPVTDQLKKMKKTAPLPPPATDETTAYAEVASLLKTDGAQIPGIVNPSQLARWINRK